MKKILIAAAMGMAALMAHAKPCVIDVADNTVVNMAQATYFKKEDMNKIHISFYTGGPLSGASSPYLILKYESEGERNLAFDSLLRRVRMCN